MARGQYCLSCCVVAVCVLTLDMCGRAGVWGYGTGAPLAACRDLRPQHDTEPQPYGECPFLIEFIGTASFFTPGKTLTVVISGRDYRGFMLQAQDEAGEALGNFSQPPSGTRLLACTRPADSFTHSDSQLKSNVQIKWTAPDDYKGHVLFKASVAGNKTTFWEDVIADLTDDSQAQPEARAQSKSATIRPGHLAYVVHSLIGTILIGSWAM